MEENHLSLSRGEKRGIVIALIIATLVFVLQIYNVFYNHDHTFDFTVSQFVREQHSEILTSIMRFFTTVGSEWVLVPGYLALIIWYFYKNKKLTSLHIFIISVSSVLMMLGLKLLFSRTRPEDSLIGEIGGYSFPSGHSYMSFTFFGLAAYLLQHAEMKLFWKRLLQVLCVLTAVMIAASRVYLGVHYFSDIVAGCCLAVMGLILTFYILHKIDITITKKK